MTKVWDIKWSFEYAPESGLRRVSATPPLEVTLDQEGYATLMELKERAAAVSSIAPARDTFLEDMDVLVRFYHEFPGTRMVARG